MASVRDVILISVLLFAIGMFLFIINFTTRTMVTAIVSVPVINATSPQAGVAFTNINKSTNRTDYLTLGLFIGFAFALIITGYYIGGHPIFMFFYFLVTGVGVYLSMLLANIWYNISTASVFGSTVVNLPITNHILTYLPYYTIGFGVLGMVMMFAKPYIQGVFQ